MSVHYRFKSTLDYDTVACDGLHISVADLKKAIFSGKKGIGKDKNFDLQITNAQTKEDYTDDNALIAKNTSLIVARVPLTAQQKRTKDRTETPIIPVANKDESSLSKSVDLTRLDGSEEDKIRAMITQSTQDYDPANYLKIRGSSQTGEVPPNYRCYKCHQPGHWIKNCPLGAGQETIEIKKSTGIPRSFMVPVDGPSVPGAMMTPGGTFAVPAIDHQAYKEGKKEKPPFAHDPEPVVEKPEIPEDLVCNICKDLLTDAVMIPCCGNSFCDECIRTFLLESEEHECPDCNEKDVSPESLIPNRYLRNAVLNFKNETGYMKRPIFKPPPTQKLTPPMVITEPTISEKLSASAATPAQVSNTPGEAEAKEADKPVGKGSPTIGSAAESAVDSDGDVAAKPLADDGTEVPPPPGTEPPLLPKRLSDSHWNTDGESSLDPRDDEYSRDKYSRERTKSFSKDNLRDRTHYYNSRADGNMRPPSRRRSLSPRHAEYAVHQNKNYAGHENHYRQAPVHYDPNVRRSAEDRAGTPTVDEPHLHPASHVPPSHMPYAGGENAYAAPPAPAPASMIPDPYAQSRMPPMYPPQAAVAAPPPPPPHGYGPPPPARYDNRAPYQQQPGYRPSVPSRGYSGPPRPMRGMHGMGYRGMQPPPPGMGRNLHNGTPGVIDDPLEAFNRMLREKDERDRRLGKHRRRATRSRSRSRSYSRSRSRSFGRRISPGRGSRSRSPPPKRRTSRSPPPLHRTRSRTPKKKRRSRSGSFSISRSRSYSRSMSPRGSLPRDRKGKRPRDAPAPYRSPVRSPPRYHKERASRDRHRSREPYSSYYNDGVGGSDYGSGGGYRDARPRYPGSRPPAAAQQTPANLIVAAAGSQVPGPPQPLPGTAAPLDRKDYYDYNRYPVAVPPVPVKRFDDVAPPGTEGYYDLPPPGVDHLDRPPLLGPKEKDADSIERRAIRPRERDDRENRHVKDDKRNLHKDRYKDDRRRSDSKPRSRRDYDFEKDGHRHDRRRSSERKHSKRSSSPYPSKYRSTSKSKDYSPERSRGKKERDYEDKPEKREKKIKEKKKKKDSDEKEKKKKKKKEKKALIQQKEAAAAAAAAAAASAVVSSSTTTVAPPVKIKEEPHSGDEVLKTAKLATPDTEKPEAQNGAEKKSAELQDRSAAEEKPKTSTAAENEAESQVVSTEETSDKDKSTESLYEGVLDEAEISTTSISLKETSDPDFSKASNAGAEETKDETAKVQLESSPKKEEFMAPVPELSKWERDDVAEKLDDDPTGGRTPERDIPASVETDDCKSAKLVTTEVLKRAENAIFQKAINAIRPIEIKKISESRKILYQNPEPKVLEPEPERETRKTVNVIINVNKNERNVELSSEPIKKNKVERSRLKNNQTSPTRLSVKERLGEKVADESKLKRHEVAKTGSGETTPRSRSPRLPKDRRLTLSPEDEPIVPNPERKVYVGERKRERIERTRIEPKHKEIAHERAEPGKVERIARTPPPLATHKVRKDEEEEKDDRRKDKKTKEELKKRKKEHRSRSKSRERKRRKDKKHKKDRSEKRQKYSKEKEMAPKDAKSNSEEKETKSETPVIDVDTYKRQRKNPKLVSDRKRSMLDESNFEPDYSASDSDSDDDDDDDRSVAPAPNKKQKLEDGTINAESESKTKKRKQSSSEDEESSSSDSSSSDSDSSVESHRKKKKKHRKRKKRRTRKDSSSDSPEYSESSDSSSEEEKHRKKKKSKSKSKQAKKKKKSKHK